MNRAPVFILAGVAALVMIFSTATFQVGEWQQAIVVQFGRPVRTVVDPGLNFKTPFVQNVVYFEKRLLEYDATPRELITQDKQQLVVDNFSRWRITDPLLFFQTVVTEAGAQSRLDDIIYSALRESIGRVVLREVVSGDRESLLNEILAASNDKAKAYGVEIVDVRLKRTELPEKNEVTVFSRMKAERERQAKKFRAEGEEESRKVRSRAERDKQVIIAEAQREASILRGEADAKATAIFAKAYNRDREFYEFLRTLEAYEKALTEGTTIVLTPASEFLKLIDSSNAR